MAITKQFLKSKPECKVKFTISAEDSGNAETASLLGDFNDWDATVTPMKKQKDGSFSVTVTLPTGQLSKFRYLLDGQHWANEPSSDCFEYCSFADAENSILSL